jgi:menaquinone-dependent protoporphyrinogen oxidase
MANILVAYATKHGQSAKIASRIAAGLGERGHAVTLREVDEVACADLERADAVVLGGPIYIVKTSRALRKLIVRERAALATKPVSLFTVCMSEAGHDARAKQEVRRVVATMLDKTGMRPEESVVFAGAVKYTAYNPLIRFVMKRISAAEGASTDTSRDHEYTDWAQVDAFAQRVADRVDAAKPHPEAAPAAR